MNSKIILAIVLILIGIGIIAYGSVSNLEDGLGDSSEITDDVIAPKILSRDLFESVGIASIP